MCGIVGVVMKDKSGFSKKAEDSFLQMLYVDALRGEDSTGVISVEKTGTFHIAKEACEATFFVEPFKQTEGGKSLFMRGAAAIGHNRKKTIGAVSDHTAHPFVVDNTFALVHNGTLYNHEKLAKTEVDSQALAQVLHRAFDVEKYATAKEGLEAELPHVNGAYAVAAYDQKTHKVHLLRNKERPLGIIETPDAWFFASEIGMIAWIATRNDYLGKDLNWIAVDPDKLHTFDLENRTMSVTDIEVKKSTPPTKVTYTGMGAGTTSTGTATSELSNKMFKVFRRRWSGQRVNFWCDDFVEKAFPLTVAEGATEIQMFGECDDITVAHQLIAEVDLSKLEIVSEEDIKERRWTGVVEGMEYRANLGIIEIYLTEVKPLVRSKSGAGTSPLLSQEYIEFTREIEGWSDGYIENYLKIKLTKLKAWQLEALNSELNARKQEKTYHENSASLH